MRAAHLASRARPLLPRTASARVAALRQPRSLAASGQAAPKCRSAPYSIAMSQPAATCPAPSFSVVMLGDTMLGRLVDEKLAVMRSQGEAPDAVWGDTLQRVVRAADARILNLECALTDHPVRKAARRRALTCC